MLGTVFCLRSMETAGLSFAESSGEAFLNRRERGMMELQ